MSIVSVCSTVPFSRGAALVVMALSSFYWNFVHVGSNMLVGGLVLGQCADFVTV